MSPSPRTRRTRPLVRPLDLTLVTLVTSLLGASGCRVVGGIFKAGIWTGIVGIVLLVAIVFGLTRMLARG